MLRSVSDSQSSAGMWDLTGWADAWEAWSRSVVPADAFDRPGGASAGDDDDGDAARQAWVAELRRFIDDVRSPRLVGRGQGQVWDCDSGAKPGVRRYIKL